MTKLDKRRLVDLVGDALFAALLETSDVTALDLLWRAEQPELALRLAGYVAQANSAELASRLLSELAKPRMQALPGLRAQVLAVVEQYLPPLSQDDIARLDTGLRANEPSELVSNQPTRLILERWLLNQPSKIADEYAIHVIEGEVTLGPDPGVLAVSLTRCHGETPLRDRVACIYRLRLEEWRDQPSWSRATLFVEACGARNPSADLLDLVDSVIGFATVLATDSLGVALTELVRQHGHDSIMGTLAGDPLPASPGCLALLSIADGLTRVDDRLDVFLAAYERHPLLRPTLVAIAETNWDDRRWQQFFRRVLRFPPDVAAPFSALLRAAPASNCSSVSLFVAADGREASDPDLRSILIDLLAEAVDEWRAGRVRVQDLLPWPKAVVDERTAFLAAVIAALPNEADQVALVVAALEAKSVTPVVAVALLPSGRTKAFVQAVRAAVGPAIYAGLLRSLLGDRDAELRQACADLQAAGMDVEIAEVLAPTAPDIAFSGALAKYSAMPTDERERLMTLLEAYGGRGQMDLIESFARASDREDRALRIRAFRLAANLIPEGGDVPDYIEAGVLVTATDVRDAAFEAAGRIKPRQIEFLARLRGIAATDGSAARPAAASLESMAAGYVAELGERGLPITRRCETLALLGAAARPASIDAILAHLGDADIDDPIVHAAAAAALCEAAPYVRFEASQLERLGALLDGEVQESEPKVRADLSAAHDHAALGPDAALALLFDTVKFRPKASPDDLFGAEKSTLIRQVGLYKAQLDRGLAGRRYALTHLDLVAERIARAAYGRLGSSESILRMIEETQDEPDLGSLIQSLDGPLSKAKAPLGVLHQARSEKTEVPHAGTALTDEEWTAAIEGFRNGANVCIKAIDEAIRKAKAAP